MGSKDGAQRQGQGRGGRQEVLRSYYGVARKGGLACKCHALFGKLVARKDRVDWLR